MSKRSIHFTFIFGLFLVIFCPLLDVVAFETAILMFLLGIVMASLSFLAILFSQDKWRKKGIWTLILIAAIGLKWISAPPFSRASFSIFYHLHKQELNEINSLLLPTSLDIRIDMGKQIQDPENQLTEEEKFRIMTLQSDLGTYYIFKDDSLISYEIRGMLDARVRIAYTNDIRELPVGHVPVTGNWYGVWYNN